MLGKPLTLMQQRLGLKPLSLAHVFNVPVLQAQKISPGKPRASKVRKARTHALGPLVQAFDTDAHQGWGAGGHRQSARSSNMDLRSEARHAGFFTAARYLRALAAPSASEEFWNPRARAVGGGGRRVCAKRRPSCKPTPVQSSESTREFVAAPSLAKERCALLRSSREAIL